MTRLSRLRSLAQILCVVPAIWAIGGPALGQEAPRCGTPDRATRELLYGFPFDPADCSASATNPTPDYDPGAIYEIPVVVHILMNDACSSGVISDDMVDSQIEILNEDFLALAGTNGENGTDAQIRFVLASEDPDGNPTTGITRDCNTTWFNDGGAYWNTLAWDPHEYMNIYTNTAGGFLGYVPFLPADGGGVFVGTLQDRVVIHWASFGRDAPGWPGQYDQGRTATHEVGHYLGLEHTFNSGASCPNPAPPACYSNGDLICDTAVEQSPRFGCPGGAQSCGSLDPIDNYMDYSDDLCMERFTLEQSRRNRCTLQFYRPALYNPVDPSAPDLSIDPASLDFGDVEVGATSAPQSVTLHNTGDGDATGLAFSPPGNGFDAETGDCGSTLAAGDDCEVTVTFTPAAAGPASAALDVDSNEGAATVLLLDGNGLAVPVELSPAALSADSSALVSDGNGVFEPGESVEVAPAWHNDGAAAASAAGVAGDFSGPPGATYSLVLDEAEYGSVEPGQTASCQDTGVCYQMGVNDPAVRPATHWDAGFEESLSDEAGHTWTLHLGDSFADVARTSGFYSAVETLLHHGITGGCSGNEYCPAAKNTRAQMPAFVLRALQGADYAPPACVEGSEVFGDVSAGHPFCAWIEELANRGVVSGCGGGDYCPGNPVTRGQMAIFLLKTLEGSEYTPPACTGVFADVACPSTFADWIEELFNRGITGGCGSEPLRYCPANPVNRQQMAVFVSKTFGLTLYGP